MADGSRGDVEQVLVVHVDDVRYGLPLDEVVEVLPAAAVVPLPGAPPVVEGLLNLRGELVPVIGLRARLGAPVRPVRESDHFVVCRVRGRSVGVLVDRAEEVQGVDPAALEAVERVAAASHLCGVARTPDGLLLVYDVPSFLSADEVLGLDRALASASSVR